MPPPADDRRLLDAFVKTRDAAAFSEIVGRYGPMVVATARRQARDVHCAEDIAQAVFLVLARRANVIDLSRGSLGGWLHRTTLLAARNASRIDARRRRHEREAIMQRMRQESVASPTMDDASLATLDDAIDALGRRDREVIALRFFETLSVDEIAARLALSEHAVKKRLFRATNRLRSRFSPKSPADLTAALSAIALPANAIAIDLTSATPAAHAVAKGTLKMITRTMLVKTAAAAVITLVAMSGGIATIAMARQQPSRPTPATDAFAAMSSSTRPAETLEDDWTALGGEEPDASAALLRLSRKPDEFVTFAQSHFIPVKLTEAQLAPLLVELGSNDDDTWRAAYEKLQYFDPRLAIELQELIDKTEDPRTLTRLIEVLSSGERGSLQGKEVGLNPFPSGGGNFFTETENGRTAWWAENRLDHLNVPRLDSGKPGWNQVVRGTMLLEHIGTPDARAIVDAMATGHPDVQPTRVAIAAIKARLVK